MGWIQNISMLRAKEGDHPNPGENSMLIQIVDPAFGFPKTKYKFSEVYQFEFLDLVKAAGGIRSANADMSL